ncbi:DnaA regulatory inactivator Hda [Kaarinaea lacus]
MQQQIPLGFTFSNEVSFDTFVAGDNGEAVTAIQNLTQKGNEHYIYIWGAKGTGKSHLMQSICQQFTASQQAVAYLSLRDRKQYSPAILDGLEKLSLVCVDDVQEIVSDPAWEEALFHFYNRMRDGSIPLLVSGSKPASQLSLKLADLKSRLGWGLIFQIKMLNDHQKLLALQKRAVLRGMELNDEAGRYLLTRYSREMGDLLQLLDKLDKASLSEQRRLTIPFIRDCI